jgi:hypothetical protein
MRQSFETPAAAERAFYQAFGNLDLGSMQQVWADLPTVYCLHPGSRLLLGYAAVMQGWARIFRGAQLPQIEYSLSAQLQNSMQEVHLVEERIGDPASPAGEAAAIVLATNVYVLTNRGWRIACHHASQVPAVSPRADSAVALH